MTSPAEEIRRQLEESARVKQRFSGELIGRIAQFAEKSTAALRAGGKLVFFGNGGSAADALHLAAELVVRLRTERQGLAALALTTNSFGTDRGRQRLRIRTDLFPQIESLVARQDILVALTTSGNSPMSCAEWRPGVRAARFLCVYRRNWRRARRQGWPSLECSFERRAAHPGMSHHHRPHRLQPD